MDTMIWGTALILIGLSLLAKSLFGIAFPMFRILAGGLLIYAGINLITNLSSENLKSQQTVFFEQKTVANDTKPKDCTVLFGKGIIDLSTIEPPKEPTKIEINTLFGTNIIKINPKIPTKITTNTAFGSTQLPDDTLISFGKYTYTSPQTRNTSAQLEIKAHTIFGSLQVQTT